MPQEQMVLKPRKKKQAKKEKLEFDAGKVFDVKAAEDIELDLDSSRYKAAKGEGGDRRK